MWAQCQLQTSNHLFILRDTVMSSKRPGYRVCKWLLYCSMKLKTLSFFVERTICKSSPCRVPSMKVQIATRALLSNFTGTFPRDKWRVLEHNVQDWCVSSLVNRINTKKEPEQLIIEVIFGTRGSDGTWLSEDPYQKWRDFCFNYSNPGSTQIQLWQFLLELLTGKIFVICILFL